MPKLDGYQVLERLKADRRLHELPVIMISALNALPPEKWSSLMYGFEPGGHENGEEETQGGGDRCEASAG
jgi:hypothetical protein